jgi:hypothetical protein
MRALLRSLPHKRCMRGASFRAWNQREPVRVVAYPVSDVRIAGTKQVPTGPRRVAQRFLNGRPPRHFGRRGMVAARGGRTTSRPQQYSY